MVIFFKLILIGFSSFYFFLSSFLVSLYHHHHHHRSSSVLRYFSREINRQKSFLKRANSICATFYVTHLYYKHVIMRVILFCLFIYNILNHTISKVFFLSSFYISCMRLILSILMNIEL